jgi:hypothetical protein
MKIKFYQNEEIAVLEFLKARRIKVFSGSNWQKRFKNY